MDCSGAWGSWVISVMLGIGEYSGRLSMVMHSSGHISIEPTLEGPEYVLHHTLCLHWREMGCALGGRWFESEVGNALCLRRT
jgi:hypothetical protein